MVRLSRMIAVNGGWPQTRIPEATFSVLSPKPRSGPQSLFKSVVHSAPPLPVIYCLWLSLLVVYLVTRTQRSGLSTKGLGQKPSWGRCYGFPSGYCCSEASGLPEHKGCCHLGDDSVPGSQLLLSQLSPQGLCVPSLSSGFCNPLCSCLCLSPR